MEAIRKEIGNAKFCIIVDEARMSQRKSRDMMAQVTCEVSGMGCKLWFQMIVHMPTTFIVSHIVCNWH
jgi:hypothetical protein